MPDRVCPISALNALAGNVECEHESICSTSSSCCDGLLSTHGLLHLRLLLCLVSESSVINQVNLAITLRLCSCCHISALNALLLQTESAGYDDHKLLPLRSTSPSSPQVSGTHLKLDCLVCSVLVLVEHITVL